MADRNTERRWLHQLTHLPTAPGREQRVMDWVERWARRRPDIELSVDDGANLLLTQRGVGDEPVVAVAHMDHPAFILTDERRFVFRGGVRGAYFPGARVAFPDSGAQARVVDYDPDDRSGALVWLRGMASVGDIGVWGLNRYRPTTRLHRGPACDDLAGVAAALAALDRARGHTPDFAVLLTRAEELGFIGAIHAAKKRTLPRRSLVISIETSPSLADAVIGGGPIIRVGDALSLFDHDLTNRISAAARGSGITHQRKLMDGGGCEATAFGSYGYRATGLCIALGNHHNMGPGDQPSPEEVSWSDYHGLVDLLGLAATALRAPWPIRARLDAWHAENSQVLGEVPWSPTPKEQK